MWHAMWPSSPGCPSYFSSSVFSVSLHSIDTKPTEPTLIFQTHFHTSLSLNMLFSLSGILSHVRYSEKLFLMPEAGPITLFPLFKESSAPYFYSMYLPELQLILYMSSPHPPYHQTGYSLEARTMCVLLIADSSAPSTDLAHRRN